MSSIAKVTEAPRRIDLREEGLSIQNLRKECQCIAGKVPVAFCEVRKNTYILQDANHERIFSFSKGRLYREGRKIQISASKGHRMEKLFQRALEYKENITHATYSRKKWTLHRKASQELHALQGKFSIPTICEKSTVIGAQAGDITGIARNVLDLLKGVGNVIAGLRIFQGFLGLILGPIGIVKGIQALIIASKIHDKAGLAEAIHKIVDSVLTLVIGCFWIAIAVLSIFCPGAAAGALLMMILFNVFFPTSSTLAIGRDSAKMIQIAAFRKKLEEYVKRDQLTPGQKYLGLANFLYQQFSLTNLEAERIRRKTENVQEREERMLKKLMRKETRFLRVTSEAVVKEAQETLPSILKGFSTHEAESIEKMKKLTSKIEVAMRKNQIGLGLSVGLNASTFLGIPLGIMSDCFTGIAVDVVNRVGDVFWQGVNACGLILDNPTAAEKIVGFIHARTQGHS